MYMSDLSVLKKMYFIVDAKGNFYHLSSNGQLVQARDKAEADMFSFTEANQRIGGGRKAKFYTTIPVDEEIPNAVNIAKNTEINTTNVLEEDFTEMMKQIVDEECPEIEYSRSDVTDSGLIEQQNGLLTLQDISELSKVDWLSYLKDFCYIVDSMWNYRSSLAKLQSQTDQEILDLLHYIELYELDDQESLETMRLLQNARERRRQAKDEMQKTEWFQNAIGNGTNAAKAKAAIKQIEKMDTRIYHPRTMPELFKNARLREQKRLEEMDYQQEVAEVITECEEEDIMPYERIETIYDTKKMDWEAMVKQQLEFFENAQQHIINLKLDIQQIDDEVEQTLTCIENANCNAAQGYQMFKKLKELRNERKEKERELASVQSIAECFDCASMADAYDYSLNEIQKINGNPIEASNIDTEDKNQERQWDMEYDERIAG